mgnify:CR=1 FL=1
MTSPNILYFDIETTPTLFAGFQLGKQHVNHTQILKRPEVMCISWAWNDQKVQHASLNMEKYDLRAKDDDADYELLKTFSKEYGKADLIVSQNGVFFDVPTITSRLVKHRLPPLPEISHDDTYLQSAKKIKHISHKLDDVGDYLGYGRKAPHGDGMDWWIAVAYGDYKILAKMVKYCDEDVNKLRKIYKHQLPYVKSKLNMAAFTGEPTCSSVVCGSKNLVKDGFRWTLAGKYQKYRCNDCGKPTVGGENLLKNTKKLPR